jgi:hypothetical protein
MIGVTTLLDQARAAIDVIQHALSKLARHEPTADQIEALDDIRDDLRALSGFARVCAAIGRQSDQPRSVN